MKKRILVVSFGTSYNESREKTIGAIERAIMNSFPEYDVRRAFTSPTIINKLKKRDGLEIDNVEEALEKAAADGIRQLVVQPTHMMTGYEYTDLIENLKEFEYRFERIVCGAPLLMDEADFEAVINAITEATAEYDDGETSICFMGHGTEADSNEVYLRLQKKIRAAGYGNYYIGTVEAEPLLEDIIGDINAKGTCRRVVLEPLMVVAGDHANNDMAGDGEDSWKRSFEAAGYEVRCILRGLGELPAIQDIYVAHARAGIEKMSSA